MAAIDTKPETRPVRFMGGNADKGTYAIIYADTTFGHGVDHVFVKRYGQEGAEFSWVSVMDDELTQRDCEPAETAAAKALIDKHSPKVLTEVSENCYRYQVYRGVVWHVNDLGQEDQYFFLTNHGSERAMCVTEMLLFKAILGVEDFDEEYIAQYPTAALVKSAAKR